MSNFLVTRTRPLDSCKEVSPSCPVEDTVLGYYPNLGSGIFFAISFGLCLIAATTLAVRTRTWTFGAAIVIGLILETSGYVGRILLHNNPWNESAFELQICAIILAPTFICVSIYLTLKHVALTLNPALSRLPPQWYPRIFLPADLSCLIVQAIGGGIAAAAGHTNRRLQEDGNRAIIAGVALQVLVLALFGVLGADYWLRVSRYMRTPEADPEALRVWRDGNFRKFAYGVIGAYVCVLVRCIYRITEMSGGWGNKIMQDEPSFLVLDSTLILITVYLLTIFHPGIYFPQMRNGAGKKRSAASASAVATQDAESEETKANEMGDSSIEGHKIESSV